jgi:hypothetical protein
VRCSDPLDRDPTIEMKQRGRGAHLGFRRSPKSRSARWSRSSARFQWLLGDGDATMRLGRTRGAGSGEHGELGSVIDVLDCVQERDGRRCAGAGALRARVDPLVLL